MTTNTPATPALDVPALAARLRSAAEAALALGHAYVDDPRAVLAVLDAWAQAERERDAAQAQAAGARLNMEDAYEVANDAAAQAQEAEYRVTDALNERDAARQQLSAAEKRERALREAVEYVVSQQVTSMEEANSLLPIAWAARLALCVMRAEQALNGVKG